MLRAGLVRSRVLCCLLALGVSVALGACSSSKTAAPTKKDATTTSEQTNEPTFDACGIKQLFENFDKLPNGEVGSVYAQVLAHQAELLAAVPAEIKPNAQSVIEFVQAVVAKKPIDAKLTAAQPANIAALRKWSDSECK